MSYKLEGKTALVTGASKGLGESISLELMKRGIYVVGTARSPPSEVFQRHIDAGRASYERADLSKDWSSLIETIYRDHGGYEIFVNNAGVLSSTDYSTQIDADRIAHEINLNLTVPTQMHVEWLKQYRDHYPNTKIPELSVNILSVSSIYSWPGGASYQASKTGMMALVASLRRMQKSQQEIQDNAVRDRLGPLTNLNVRYLAVYLDSTDTGIISMAEKDSLYKVKGDFLPIDVSVDFILKSIEASGNYGKYDDIAILTNPTDPETREELKGAFAAFLPLDEETQRHRFDKRIMEKIAEPEILIKGRN